MYNRSRSVHVRIENRAHLLVVRSRIWSVDIRGIRERRMGEGDQAWGIGAASDECECESMSGLETFTKFGGLTRQDKNAADEAEAGLGEKRIRI